MATFASANYEANGFISKKIPWMQLYATLKIGKITQERFTTESS
jgi:hypothetical protein